MKQLEIEFFYPLTEQIQLDLDFTPSEEWQKNWNESNRITSNGSILVGGGIGTTSISPYVSSFVIKPSEKNVGKWEITENMFVYRPTKPNAVIRFMAKYLLGFKWRDGN